MQSDNYILNIAGPNFTKLAMIVHLMIVMHLRGLDVESEPSVSDAEGG